MPIFAFGPFVLDTTRRQLIRSDRGVALPRKAWQILELLAEAGGRLVTHEAFRARLWPDVVVEDRTLTVHVSTLRKALGPDMVETVARAGYRLAIPVRTFETRPAQRSPHAAEAHRLQLLARENLQRFSPLPAIRALGQFEQARALDPGEATIHAGLASAYLQLGSTALGRQLQANEAMPRAREAALHAIAIDPAVAEAWAVLGRVKMEYDWDWDGADADFAQAVAVDPGSIEAASFRGQFLSAMGRHGEAVAAMEQARRLAPGRLQTLQFSSMVYWLAGQPERGLSVMAEALAIDARSFRGRIGRMVILDHLGRHEEAMAERLEFLQQYDGTMALADRVAWLARHDGWRAAMIEWLSLLERIGRFESAALQWMVLGEESRGLELFERSVSRRSTLAPFARQIPSFRGLANDGRWREILRTLGLDGRGGAALS